MAFIVREDGEGGGVQKELRSPLSLAPLDRAISCLELAQMGVRESQREWNLFAEESPGVARVVAKYVAAENAKKAAATKVADKMLRRGEAATGMPGGLLVKSWKGGKPKKVKKVAKVAGGGTVTKAARRAAADRQDAVRALLREDLASADPQRREMARDILRGLG